MRFEQHRAGGEASVLGIDPAGAWQHDGLGDSIVAAPAPVAAFLRGHEFLYLALAPETRLAGPEPRVRVAPFDGRDVPTLRFGVPAGGFVDIHYDEASGRPLGLTIPDPGGTAGPPVRVRYADWETIGNLRLPLRVAIEHGAELFGYALGGGVRIDVTPDTAFRRSGDFGADADLAELRRLQREARTAHLEYDAERLVASFHDPLTGVAAGRVESSTPAENRVRFGGYLNSVEFDEWADTAPPRFRLSADRTMAYVIVQKRVRLRTRSTPPVTEAAQFAWMEAWEKIDGRWRLMAVASTDRPLEGEDE
jgi:hypothetical protein